MPYFSVKVPPTYKGEERLDKYIANLPNGMNRSKLKSGVVGILVNGKKQKVSFKVKACDTIDIEWEDSIPDDIVPENIPLDILYEDDDVCVVNKKQGMVTHPACGNWNGTLVNALLYHWGRESIPELKNADTNEILANRRPGIVHRLDKDTSGVMITAKNRDAEEYLASQFRDHRKIYKEYICICLGRPHEKSGFIRTRIVRDMRDRKKYRAEVGTDNGKHAESYYKVVCCYGEYSLIRVRIFTGRTHQIRVHMKYLNCPIVGDTIYSKPDRNFPKATLMLNASVLRIKLPGKENYSTFRTKTPERFLKMMKKLQKDYRKVLL